MSKEIGSIFELDIKILFEEVVNKEFKFEFEKNSIYSKQYFNTGRSAISYLFQEYLNLKNYEKKVLLPSFLCSSIVEAIELTNTKYDFYKIKPDLRIDEEDLKKKVDDTVGAIFFIHYFGFPHSKEVCDLLKNFQNQGILLIEDLTQSLFTKNENLIGFGDYILGSIRKWGAIPDGGVLASKKHKLNSNNDIYEAYNEYICKYLIAQLMKHEYLKEDTLDKTKYLKLISDANEVLFSDLKIRQMSWFSQNLLMKVDINRLKKQRRINWNYVREKLKYNEKVKILYNNDYDENNVPFGIVISTDKRDELISYLINNNIYCNIHWKLPKQLPEEYKEIVEFSKKLLTIPCDERYKIEDFEYIVNLVNKFFYGKGEI